MDPGVSLVVDAVATAGCSSWIGSHGASTPVPFAIVGWSSDDAAGGAALGLADAMPVDSGARDVDARNDLIRA